MKAGRSTLPFLAAISLAACTPEVPEDGVESGGGLAIDSAGIRVVTLPPMAEMEVIRPEAEDLVAFYGFEDTPVEALRSLSWAADGTVLLADADRRVVRLTLEGEEVAVLGRVGEGPGEYFATTRVRGTVGGGAVLFDSRRFRVTAYDAQGVLDSAWAVPAPPDGRVWGSFHIGPDGGLLATMLLGGDAPSRSGGVVERPPGSGVRWRMVDAVRLDSAGATILGEVVQSRCSDEPTDRCVGDLMWTSTVVVGAGTTGGSVLLPADRPEARWYGPSDERPHTLVRGSATGTLFPSALVDFDGRLWLWDQGWWEEEGHWLATVWDGTRAYRVAFPEGFALAGVREGVALGSIATETGVRRLATIELGLP